MERRAKPGRAVGISARLIKKAYQVDPLIRIQLVAMHSNGTDAMPSTKKLYQNR
jgi:hypothetical protein